MSPILERAILGLSDVEINGAEIGTRFVVQFSGPAHLAAQRARNTHGVQRDAGDKWLELNAALPAGGQARFYLDFGRSNSTILREVWTKRAAAQLRARYRALPHVAPRGEYAVFTNCRPFARVTVQDDGNNRVEINQPVAGQCAVDAEIARAGFERAYTNATPATQWG